jgi:hypothetical protein
LAVSGCQQSGWIILVYSRFLELVGRNCISSTHYQSSNVCYFLFDHMLVTFCIKITRLKDLSDLDKFRTHFRSCLVQHDSSLCWLLSSTEFFVLNCNNQADLASRILIYTYIISLSLSVTVVLSGGGGGEAGEAAGLPFRTRIST